MNDRRRPGQQGQSNIELQRERQRVQHEENRELLNEIAGDVRSLRERYDDNMKFVNEKLELIFEKLDQAAAAATKLGILEARVRALEDSHTNFARMSWGVLLAVITLAIEAVIRAFHR